MLAQNQGMLQKILNYFCNLEILAQNKNGIFQNLIFLKLIFSKTSLNTKTRYLNNFESIGCMDMIHYTNMVKYLCF